MSKFVLAYPPAPVSHETCDIGGFIAVILTIPIMSCLFAGSCQVLLPVFRLHGERLPHWPWEGMRYKAEMVIHMVQEPITRFGVMVRTIMRSAGSIFLCARSYSHTYAHHETGS